MNKWSELLIGLIVLTGTILLSWMSSEYSWTLFGKDFNFLHSAWVFFKGGVFWLLIMVGVLLITLGISDLKD